MKKLAPVVGQTVVVPVRYASTRDCPQVFWVTKVGRKFFYLSPVYRLDHKHAVPFEIDTWKEAGEASPRQAYESGDAYRTEMERQAARAHLLAKLPHLSLDKLIRIKEILDE